MRSESVIFCLSEHLSIYCFSKTNTKHFRKETLLMQPTLICCSTVTQEMLILIYSSAFPRNISHQVCLCVVFPFFTADCAGWRPWTVFLHLAAVWGFILTVEPFQKHHIHLPSRCCGGQREGFSENCRYVNTTRKTLSHYLPENRFSPRALPKVLFLRIFYLTACYRDV